MSYRQLAGFDGIAGARFERVELLSQLGPLVRGALSTAPAGSAARREAANFLRRVEREFEHALDALVPERR